MVDRSKMEEAAQLMAKASSLISLAAAELNGREKAIAEAVAKQAMVRASYAQTLSKRNGWQRVPTGG